MNTLLTILLGSFIVTSYQSIPSQTDSTPYITSTGDFTNPGGVAVHPSLLCPRAKYPVNKAQTRWKLCRRGPQCAWKDKLHYYDVVYIEDIGIRHINDVMAWKTNMNAKWDVWVKTPAEEKLHHSKFKNRRLKVWLIHKVKFQEKQ